MWNIQTVPRDEYLDEMMNLVRQIPKNFGNAENLQTIAKSIADMVNEIQTLGKVIRKIK